MKSYISNVVKIREHKRSHKDTLNSFDPFSEDITVNGILSRKELWEKELPNQKNGESIFICGTNTKNQSLTLKLNRIPAKDDSNNKVNDYHYSYHLILDIGNQNYYSAKESGISYNISKKDNYQVSGLLLEVLEPFQRWRIKFVGLLKDKNNELIFVRMRLLWISNSEVFDFNSNCDTSYLSKQLSNSNLSIDAVFEDRYVGCGQLKGIIQLNNEKEQEIYLWGMRSKSIIIDEQSNESYRKSQIMGYSEKGIAFEINKISVKQTNKSCIYGFGSNSDGFVFPLQGFKYNALDLDESKCPFPKSFSYKANDKYFTVENLEIHKNGICYMSINGHNGSGVLLKNIDRMKKLDLEQNSLSLNPYITENSEELVLKFDEKSARNEGLTGGKGSSLSMLTYLSKQENASFIVPKGFIVTTNSYQMLLKESPQLREAVEKLQLISWHENRENLSKECENLINSFVSTEIPSLVKNSIRDALKCFDKNSNYDDILFAVRSSSCGEDSEDMSAAGQMTTYLGIKGLDNICDCVMKCWSSQFSITAVEYKRGYGQLINSPMAVVVQEIVDCDVAGVMFTCDPINGDPRKILITSNYGIGESVVSASVNPDNITLAVNLELNKRFIQSINSIEVGTKETSIRINSSSGFGTEVKSNDILKDQCSLSESEALKLGEIGLNIYSYFGCERDIEWGIKGGMFYMFQSRPVTNLDSYTEWELMHELDTGHNDQTEYNSRVNLGEVMPGAMSHLFLTTVFREIGLVLNGKRETVSKMRSCSYRRLGHGMSLQNNAVFLNMKDAGVFQFAPEERETFMHKAIVLAAFGHVVEDQQLRIDCFERSGKQSFKTKIRTQNDALKDLLFGFSKLKSSLKKYQDFDLLNGQNFNSSAEMMEFLINKLYLFFEPSERHVSVTIKSSIYNLILLSILSKGNLDVNTNPYLITDFANLLSMTGNNIVSADVPSAIKCLAQSISNPQVFAQITPEQALESLQNTDQESGIQYKKFIESHGHRGYKEFDLMSNTWKDNPILLVKTIQTMIPIIQKQNEKVLSTDDLLQKIKTPLNRKNRLLLKKWIIPACHKSVANREEGKNFIVRIIDKFRQFFREVGKQMSFKEGRIPSPDLVFYLTLDELKRLTEFRDPKIVMKAKQRKKIYPKIDKYIYNEMVIGPEMKPKNLSEENLVKHKYLNGPNSIIKGTPVSTGSVTARVCVAKCFDDAKHIQPGDILVTYSTDIGWSPYFPILSGIITEIGGLVSHGAVIAREYGLPCLVGVENACQLIFSGDTILLDADNGQIVLMRISES